MSITIYPSQFNMREDGAYEQLPAIQGAPGADGADGADGAPGADGNDGISPTVSVSTITGGHRITVTDAGGTDTFDVMDGVDGQDGQDGQDGAPGRDGADGADGAPGAAATIAVGTVTGLPAGSTPTVTNSGTSAAAVFNFGIPAGADGQDGQDGQDGRDGVGIPTGGTVGQILTKQSADDYDVAWGNQLQTISVAYYYFDNWSISGNSQGYQDFDVSSEVGNKTLLGIIGIDQYSASSSGANTNNCVLRRFVKIDNTHVRVSFRNVGSSAAKIGGTIVLLLSS